MPLLVTHSHFILFGHCLAVVKEHERLGEPRGPMNKFFLLLCWIAMPTLNFHVSFSCFVYNIFFFN